jgi:hypothetical protein
MKCWFGRLLTLTCLLFVTNSLRADSIQWSYAWTRDPLSVASDAKGTGGISLTLGQGLPMTGNSDITAVNLSTFSSAPMNTVDHFTHAPFNLGLTVTDAASGSTGKTSFTGEFNGTLSPTSAQITATFDQSPHQLTIGSHIYSVALTSYAAPGIPDSTTVGSIGAHVAITDATTGGGSIGVSHAPEPATIILAALATPTFALMCWRRRQAAKVAPSAC